MSNAEDKLKRIEESNRQRATKHLKKAKRAGKRQISAIITEETYNEICRRRDKKILAGEQVTIGKIIEAAIFPIVKSEKSGIKETQGDLFEDPNQ